MLIKLYPMLKKGLSLGMLLFAASTMHAQYCAPVPAAIAPCYDPNPTAGFVRITSVTTTGAILNINNANNACVGYTYYSGTNNTVRANAGTNVSISVNCPAASSRFYRCVVWVDWNRNDSFEDNGAVYNVSTNNKSEMMFLGPSSQQNGIYTGSFLVPPAAANGMTRMRIRAGTSTALGFPPNTPYLPCAAGNFLYGEVEDYDFEIINPCLAPSAVNFNNITDKSVSITWSPRANAKFYEYLVTKTKGIPASGNYYTTQTTVNLPDALIPIECDMKYYVYTRSICDTGKGGIAEPFWDKSGWREDSFKTNPCCYMPEVTINNITSTSAIASWLPVPSVVKYEYVISVDTNMVAPQSGTKTTQTSVLLKGLAPSQDYIFWLRALCTPTPYSDWRRVTFLTQPYLGIPNTIGDEFEVQAYPNPVKDVVTMEIAKGIRVGNATATLSDVTGKVLMQTRVTGDKIDFNMSDKPAGVYILKYNDDLNTQVLKITKQ